MPHDRFLERPDRHQQHVTLALDAYGYEFPIFSTKKFRKVELFIFDDSKSTFFRTRHSEVVFIVDNDGVGAQI